jgi:hypothetical protein
MSETVRPKAPLAQPPDATRNTERTFKMIRDLERAQLADLVRSRKLER